QHWRSGIRWHGRCRGWRPSAVACAAVHWRAAWESSRLSSGYGAGVTEWKSRMTEPKSRIQPGPGPGLIRGLAAEFDAIVQAERTVVPEFDPARRDAPAAPARRARPLADGIVDGHLRAS